MTPATVPDLRGKMFRSKRLTPDAEAREFLRNQKIAHVGTVDGNGWPYVVPLVYIYEGGDYLYLHTGAHQGHFLTNLQRDSRICVEVSTIGPFTKASATRAILRWFIPALWCLVRRAFSITIGRRNRGFSTGFSPNTGMRHGCLIRVTRCSATSSCTSRGSGC
jgi:Pyridoxamine 5'-phosphate oxidase